MLPAMRRCVRVLLEAGANPLLCNGREQSATQLSQDEEVTDIIAEWSSRPNVIDMTLEELQGASHGNLDINVADEEGRSALALAVLATGELCGICDEDPTQTRSSSDSLSVAKDGELEEQMKRRERISALLKLKADPNLADAKQRAPLHVAAEQFLGSAQVIQLLVDAKASTESVYENCTPLMRAARVANAEAIAVLVQVKADVNAGDVKRKQCALGLMLEEGDMPTARLLLEAKASPNSRSAMGTVVHSVVMKKNAEGLALLLEHNCDLSERTSGKLPHHLAARAGALEVLKLLLTARAEVCAEDAQGNTALALAEVNRKTDCVELLGTYMQDT